MILLHYYLGIPRDDNNYSEPSDYYLKSPSSYSNTNISYNKQHNRETYFFQFQSVKKSKEYTPKDANGEGIMWST